MTNNNSIFITYNNNNPQEQTLAIRLHTIGAVNGFTMYLPDRYNSNLMISEETKQRIIASNYVILFSLTDKISNTVAQEIEFAHSIFKDKSKIIVIYNTHKVVKNNSKEHFTQIKYDPSEQTMDSVIHTIISTINNKEKNGTKKNDNSDTLIALLGIGLGLAALALFANDNK